MFGTLISIFQDHTTQENPSDKYKVRGSTSSKQQNQDVVLSDAMLRLLQNAFHAQLVGNNLPKKMLNENRDIPYEHFYQVLEKLNQGPELRHSEESLYSDYVDLFYNSKSYKHRDDRLLQALIDILNEEN